ncbi:MAG: AMP-binding protein [Cyclobacteriaceae bacterium]
MENRPWLQHYGNEIPQEIDADCYSSIAELLEEAFKNYSDRVAFSNFGKELTFKDIDRLSRDFAAYLQNVAGLKKGDKLAVQMPNLLQYPIVVFGALRAGVTVVNTNPLYTPSEMEHQFKDSDAKAIVILANFAANLEKILPNTNIETVIVTEIGDMLGGLKGWITNFVVKNVKKMVPSYSLPKAIPFKSVMKEGEKATFNKVEIANDDLAFLQYTGGTTGVSKGAMLTNRNIIANVQQLLVWMQSGGLRDKEIVITALPLYHIFALTVNLMIMIQVGAKNVLITNPREMDGFCKEMKKHKFTVITGVNTLFVGMLNNPIFQSTDFSSLKFGFGGGMAVQKFTSEKWKEVTNSPLCEGYGLTETSPVLTSNLLKDNGTHIKTGYIGIPMPSTDIRILDDDGNDVAPGTPGELCAKGPQVMKGYWGRPKETEDTFTDGWLKTGDIATMDEDGFFKIVDRKKEMILVSGFNVYPNEVEDAVASHPKVKEVGAIAVPDKKSNEAVKIYIVKSDDSLTEEEIKAHCKECLTGYKRPKYVAFTDDLPKSNVGKILRRILKEEDLKNNSYD